jgi:hypothetical protein
MQKTKTKVSKLQKPNEQEVFGRVLCNIEIMQDLYEELKDINESLIDDLCYATERIESLEKGFIKGIIVATLIIGSLWILSLI